jgi:hypothetical protein
MLLKMIAKLRNVIIQWGDNNIRVLPFWTGNPSTRRTRSAPRGKKSRPYGLHSLVTVVYFVVEKTSPLETVESIFVSAHEAAIMNGDYQLFETVAQEAEQKRDSL